VPFEEPERFGQMVRELLVSSTTMADPTFNEFLIAALQTLAARPLTNRKELAAWRLEANRLEESFTPDQADSLPDFVWHYLGDADIRLRNAGYRADQERRLQQVFREFRPQAFKAGPRRRQ
jgi:hypothetical protein